MTNQINSWITKHSNTAFLILSNGSIIKGLGLGAYGTTSGEVCFNTSITGYQEILTDPSYSGQIITFTFPHIGNVGTNDEDIEMIDSNQSIKVKGCIFNNNITLPSNYRSKYNLNDWLKIKNITGITKIDTRAITNLIRKHGVLNAVIAYNDTGNYDFDSFKDISKKLTGIKNIDLAKLSTVNNKKTWNQLSWVWKKGYEEKIVNIKNSFNVVVIDFGIKSNILRLLTKYNFTLHILPATSTINDIMSCNPDGVFLSNGPGDPQATALYTSKVVKEIIYRKIPTFGICLGHQIMSIALGGKTIKMHQGHHGANHPVKNLNTGKVEITSMNHSFTVDRKTLPDDIQETHISLFDGSNCGMKVLNYPAFSVQYHPEASPGPQDSYYLFNQFYKMISKNQ